MTQRIVDTWKTLGSVASVLAVLVMIVTLIYSMSYGGRIEQNSQDIHDTRVELRGHKENMIIHRTAEEGRAWERGEQVWRELLMDRLQSIDKRLEKLEGKP